MSLKKFLKRFRTSTTVGCDFGGSSFKMVQLQQKGESLQLASCGMREVNWDAENEAAAQQVQIFLQEHGGLSAKATINLDNEHLHVRRLELANMPERDLKLAIRWNFRDVASGDLDCLHVAHSLISEGESGRSNYIIYSAMNDMVGQAQERAKSLGLKVHAIEPNVSALVAAFAHNQPDAEDSLCALINVGYNGGNFLVISGGSTLVFARQLRRVRLEVLADALTPVGATREAHWAALHRLTGDPGALSEEEKSNVRDCFSSWLVELQESIDTYAAECSPGGEDLSEVSKIYVSGGAGLLPAIDEVIATNLGVPAAVFNPFAQITDMQGQPVEVPDASLYAVAVGLAMPWG